METMDTPEGISASQLNQDQVQLQEQPQEQNQAQTQIQTQDQPQTPKSKKGLVLASAFICVITVVLFVVAIIISRVTQPAVATAKILDVIPTSIENGALNDNSHFIIKTENASPENIRKAIYLEPAIDYHIQENIPGSEYEIIPASRLADNTVFNVDSVEGETISYKWAFQTENQLSVSRIYPANGANYVSENSVIEFSFSYPNIENVTDHFSITPAVDGTLEKLDFSWRFTPSEPLAKDTTYEVTISAGLKYGEQTMTKDFHSSFSTFEHSVASSDTKNQGITLDGVSTFTESENPVVVFTGSERKYLDDAAYVSVEKIDTPDAFIKHLQGEQVTTAAVGNYDFEKTALNNYGYSSAVLNQTLPTGYYIFNFKSDNGQNLYTADIEVNNLAAYAFESERDVLVWVAESGELKSGVKVVLKNKDFQTGDNGLLVIKNASDYSDKLDYLKIGNTDQPLVIAIQNFKNDTYPRGFIYTDRLLYMPNDTIKIWGYIPLAFFKDAPNRENFNIVFDSIKQQITIDKEGFFSTEIKLDNYKDTSGQIKLEYNDAALATRWIEVANYTLENYTYEFVTPKNYVYAGENINFTVKVSHVTGFPAINKDVVVTYQSHDYYGTTNGNGEVEFSLPTNYSVATWERPSNYDAAWVSAKSGGAEYNKYSTSTTFFIFKDNLLLSGTHDIDAKKLEFTAKVLNLGNNTKVNYGFRDVEQSNYSGPAKVRFYETRYSRYVSSYRYNEYTKENVPVYTTNSITSVISEIDANFENGKFICDYPTDFKDPEENVYYNYHAAVSTTDPNGRPAYSYSVYYHNSHYLGQSNSYNDNAIWSYGLYRPIQNEAYYLYRFGLKDTAGSSPYSLGDTLKLGLYDHTGANIENQGQVLAIAYQENIISTDIFSDNTLDLKFDQKLYPGAEIVGAYFIDGKFHRIAPQFRDYNEADSKLSVKIEPDKSSYEPGEEVTAKVIVTHEDGSRASGRVNLSVVNEAIFNALNDDTSILSSIYSNKYFKSYSMSTFRDYELIGGAGLGSAGGGRSNFGDTIFFGEQTLENGEATFKFKLNDSITSFRLTALAVENGPVINAGVGVANISSYLPLSISTVIPKKVKNTDDLVLNAKSVVSSGDNINYAFKIKELDQSLTASAAPGGTVSVNFGKLNPGQYTIIISAEDSAGNTDNMIYPIEIVETAQEVAITKTIPISQDTVITPTKNPIILEIYDSNTAEYLKFLNYLEANRTSRLDTIVAYYKSLEYKNKYYGEESTMPVPKLDNYLAADGTLKPLENAEGDLILTALANYYAGEYFSLKAANYDLSLSDDLATTIQKLLVLSSFKAPVLLDLKAAASLENITNSDRLLIGLSFAFLGDYNSAKSIYENLDTASLRPDLLAVLTSFIDKSTTATAINSLIESSPALEYLPFAVISFFENNAVDLSSKSTVDLTISDTTEKLEISPLRVVKRICYINDLSDLSLKSSSDNLFVTYYYQGKLTELGEAFTTDLSASLSGDLAVGQTIELVLDISALTGTARNGGLNIALPSNLKLSGTFSAETGLYLIRNNNEYFKLSLSENYKDNFIRIPLYVAAPGNYEFEPVVFTSGDTYHLSNSFTFSVE